MIISRSKEIGPSDVVLPPYVYWSWKQWEASLDYREIYLLRKTVEGKITCRNVYQHREGKKGERDAYDLYTWDADLQRNVCLYCHPEYATVYGVMILDWLYVDRRERYLHLLKRDQDEQKKHLTTTKHK